MFNKNEKKCGNCQLYSPKEKICKVVVLWEGERHNLPTDFNDDCFFEQEFIANGEKFIPAEKIKQVKFWVEDPNTGEKKSGDGVVKIEYPEGFFGDETNRKNID